MDYEHNLFEIMDTLKTQVGGDHYREMKIQPTEFIHANGIGFIAGNVIKYVCRHRMKNGKQDLEKAAHYLQMLISMEYPDVARSDFEKMTETEQEHVTVADDGWIPWGGGERPVDGMVFVKFNDGTIRRCSTQAVKFNWHHVFKSANIVAYKIAIP